MQPWIADLVRPCGIYAAARGAAARGQTIVAAGTWTLVWASVTVLTPHYRQGRSQVQPEQKATTPQRS
jgi:hypothetical protein